MSCSEIPKHIIGKMREIGYWAFVIETQNNIQQLNILEMNYMTAKTEKQGEIK